VCFPGLGQIKPQVPRLEVLFRQFLQVSALRPYSPPSPQAFNFSGQSYDTLLLLFRVRLWFSRLGCRYPKGPQGQGPRPPFIEERPGPPRA